MNKLIVALALVASTAVAQTDPLVIEWVVPKDGKPWELTQDGDQLVTLEWPTSTFHNVHFMRTKEAYDACDFTDTAEVDSKVVDGNNVVVIEPAPYGFGSLYFACEIGRHCQAGQKLHITVAQGTTPAPSVTEETLPPSAGSTTPAPASSDKTMAPTVSSDETTAPTISSTEFTMAPSRNGPLCFQPGAQPTVWEIINDDEEDGKGLEKFERWVKQYKLDNDLDDPLKTWTVFGPTDKAVDAFPKFARNILGRDLIEYHLLEAQALTSEDLKKLDDVGLEMKNGDEVHVHMHGTELELEDSAENHIKFVQVDIVGCNGIVHKIDMVMLYDPDDTKKGDGAGRAVLAAVAAATAAAIAAFVVL